MIQLDAKLLLRNPTHSFLQLILEPSSPSDGLRDPAPPKHHVEPKDNEFKHRMFQPALKEALAAFRGREPYERQRSPVSDDLDPINGRSKSPAGVSTIHCKKQG